MQHYSPAKLLVFVLLVAAFGCGKGEDIPAIETQAAKDLKVSLNESASQSNTISSQRNAKHPVVADFNYQATQNGTIQLGSPGWEVSTESCPLRDAVKHEWLVLNSDGTVLSSVMVDDSQLFPVTTNAKYIWRTTLTPPAGCEPSMFFGWSYNFSVIFVPAS